MFKVKRQTREGERKRDYVCRQGCRLRMRETREGEGCSSGGDKGQEVVGCEEGRVCVRLRRVNERLS